MLTAELTALEVHTEPEPEPEQERHRPSWARAAAAASALIAANVLVAVIVANVWPDSVRFISEAWWGPWRAFRSGAYNTYLLTLSVVLVVDLIALGPRNSALGIMARRSRSATIDTVFGIGAAVGLLTVAVAAFSAGLYPVVGPAIVDLLRPLLLAPRLPVPAHIALYFVTVDFLSYWHHRWCHSSPWLWRYHAFHHSSTTFVVLTGNRVHPFEIVSRQFVTVVPLVALGTPLAVPLAVTTVRRAVDQFQHSMVPWTFGWIGSWVVFSPIGHRIHHSPDREHWDSNYGDIFTIWDRMFGTWYGGAQVNDTVGLGTRVERLERRRK